MAEAGLKWKCAVIFTVLLIIGDGVSAADQNFDVGFLRNNGTTDESESDYLTKIISSLQQNNLLLVHHVWPVTSFSYFLSQFEEMKFDWRIIVGTVIGFLAAALGSVGGVGGGGIFVPMLKSSDLIQKHRLPSLSVRV